MKKKLTLLLTILSLHLAAQNYFQQKVNYTIDVELNDEDHTLKGMVYIDYTNNSPDELDFLWFHIWPNAYKDNTTSLAKQKLEDGSTSLHYATEEERGYITNLDFKVNGKSVKWNYHPEHIDICKLILDKPIRAGESIRISTPFFVKIPDAKFSRLGHLKQSYMITQWYPKPAVYDKDGWHPMPYLDQGEFYSEFGSFDVSITLPSNYTVGATGNLQNKDETKRLNKLAKATDTITKFSEDLSFPASSLNTKTLRYTENNIHDFGWFADKRFHVLKGEVKVPHTNEKITIWTMFTNNEADLWKNSIEYMHDALYYYSLWNGDYPYKHCTAVDGTISAGGGMEYPNVTVIGESGSAYLLEEVIMHEVGHNWFYGMLGSNERDHPWMDEGLNSHNEIRYMRTKYPDYNMFVEELPPIISKALNLDEYNHKQTMGELIYMMNAWTGKDQPIELHSEKYTSMNYGGIVYSKTAIVFDYLMAYLGEDIYDQCMKTYFAKWKFKHPQPEDLKLVFEEVSGKNLSWFFDDVIGTVKKLDYAILDIKKEAEYLLITLENKGDIAGPVVISGVKEKKSSSPLWIEGFEGKKMLKYLNRDYDHIRIDYYGDIPEINRNNNIIRLKGILKKIEPIRFQLLGSMYHPEKTQIFFIPVINYNVYDRYSYGLSLYNRFIPKEGLSYKITPMYSNGNKNLSGSLNLTYSKFNSENNIYNYKISLDAKKAMYNYGKGYIRLEPKLDITLKQSSLRSKKDNYLSASYVHLEKEKETLGFMKGKYTFSNARTISPYSVHFQIEKGDEYTKANLILNYNYHLNKKKRIAVRGYVGLVKTDNNIYNIQMSAWNGSNDYMFSENTLVRDNKNINDIAYNQQLFIKEGGIKHNTNDSLNSNNMLSTISLEYNLTNRFRLYAEVGTNGKNYAYGSGLRIPMINNMFNIYLPIYTEDGMVKIDGSYQEKVRFGLSLNLNMLMSF